MNFKSGIKELVNNYEYFIFDIWGVVHDGSAAYPNVVEVISYLRSKNRKICFLSNAPRRAAKVALVLEKFGITPDLYDFILTSGEAAYLDLEKNQKNNFQDFGQNYLYIGPEKDRDLLEGLNYNMVDSASQADVAITTGFDNDYSTIEEKLPQIKDAKDFNLPMLCVNPDLIVIRQSGLELLCAGEIAKEYKKMGGEVSYYGKPYETVYKMVCKIFKCSDTSKMLAIGDALETDVKGASSFGIDSALVTSGILSNILGTKYGQEADRDKLEKVLNESQIFPQFIIPNI